MHHRKSLLHSRHSHTHDQTTYPETQGRTIHWASKYDSRVRWIALGRDRTLRDRTIRLAEIKPGENILDVGCGTGEVTLRAKAATGRAGSVYGIDASPEMVEVARQKAQQHGLDITFQVDLIERLSFPDASFDVIFSSLMMHHLPGDLKRRGLEEMRRVLKPGGRLVIVDFRRPTNWFFKAFLALMFHGGLRQGVEDLVPLVQQAGFSAIEEGVLTPTTIGFVRAVAG